MCEMFFWESSRPDLVAKAVVVDVVASSSTTLSTMRLSSLSGTVAERSRRLVSTLWSPPSPDVIIDADFSDEQPHHLRVDHCHHKPSRRSTKVSIRRPNGVHDDAYRRHQRHRTHPCHCLDGVLQDSRHILLMFHSANLIRLCRSSCWPVIHAQGFWGNCTRGPTCQTR